MTETRAPTGREIWFEEGDEAAEYVPAIGDAFALIDKHFGDAISPHHRGATQ